MQGLEKILEEIDREKAKYGYAEDAEYRCGLDKAKSIIRKYMNDDERKEKVSLLKEATGRGVFECKKALEHSEWDVNKSVEWLSEHSTADLMRMDGDRGSSR